AASLVVKGNFIHAFATGVRILGTTPATVTVRANFLAANTKAIDHSGTNVLDAPFNYYGAANDTSAEVDAQVTGTVNFEPFALTIAAGDSLADRDFFSKNGFQPRLELGVVLVGKKF